VNLAECQLVEDVEALLLSLGLVPLRNQLELLNFLLLDAMLPVDAPESSR
jgi:hypothetical protein